MNALANVILQDTPIDWDRYVLTEDDLSRFLNPAELVTRISDVLHARGARQGIPLAWRGVEHMLRFRPGKLALWAGINFHGKTTMLKQHALHFVRCGHKVCIANLEDEPEESLLDVVQMLLPDVDIRTSDDWIDVACNWMSGKLWYYSQRRMMTPQRILALIAYAAKEKGCTHFVLDSLMRTALAQDDYEGQRVFVNQLTNYASTLGITIHLVHHIVKADESSVPGRDAIRGTGAITDQADYVFIVWRDTREQKGIEDADGLLIVAKNRGLRPANWIGRIKVYQHNSGQFLRGKTDEPIRYIDLITP